MLLAISRNVDPRLDRAIRLVYGDPIGVIAKECESVCKTTQRGQRYVTYRRLARCPNCYTWTRHPVEKVLKKGNGSLLECVWCWKLFNTKGNCR
jgi:hypothetical protein